MHTYISFSDADDIVHEGYADFVHQAPPVEALSGMARFVEDNDNLGIGDASLSKDANVRASLRVDSVTTQAWHHQFDIRAPKMASDVLELYLQGLKR